eukprot:5089401-Amphidinium_carterae.3
MPLYSLAAARAAVPGHCHSLLSVPTVHLAAAAVPRLAPRKTASLAVAAAALAKDATALSVAIPCTTHCTNTAHLSCCR